MNIVGFAAADHEELNLERGELGGDRDVDLECGGRRTAKRHRDAGANGFTVHDVGAHLGESVG